MLSICHAGTENPADEDDRTRVAVDKTGGSYCITQRWIHKMDTVHNTKGTYTSSNVTGLKNHLCNNWEGYNELYATKYCVVTSCMYENHG